jgi:hypothetical protein
LLRFFASAGDSRGEANAVLLLAKIHAAPGSVRAQRSLDRPVPLVFDFKLRNCLRVVLFVCAEDEVRRTCGLVVMAWACVLHVLFRFLLLLFILILSGGSL